MKKLLSIALLSAITTSCVIVTKQPVTENNNKASEASAPKNIIMIVGDGMGPAYTTAYRYFADNPNTQAIEETVFDRHFVGMASTFPASVSGYITDSAAAATALSAGIKTYNGAVGVDNNKQPVETVLERAKKLGKKTGVVVTSQVNHATPASYLSHNEYRRNYNAIADSYIDDGIKADVILGGGWKYFIRNDRNLVDEFVNSGFQYIDKYEQLDNLDGNKPILGLFGNKGLPWSLDDSNKYRLSQLTKVATKHLENKSGYFMLVEASQVDWAGHGRDIASAMAEMDDLAKTLEYLERYVEQNPDTLVVLTADHSTGGLSMGRKTGRTNEAIISDYLWQPEYIRQIKSSPYKISKQFVKQTLTNKQLSELLGFTISSEDYDSLQKAKLSGDKVLADYLALSKEEQKKKWKPNPATNVEVALKSIIDTKTNTGWGGVSRSATHTSVDVQVFALGSNKDKFKGLQDNTDIAKKIFTLLNKK